MPGEYQLGAEDGRALESIFDSFFPLGPRADGIIFDGYDAENVGLRVRVSRSLGGGRFVAGLACGALLPVARVVPGLVALALVAAVWVALHAYELIWWRAARAETPSTPASGAGILRRKRSAARSKPRSPVGRRHA